MKHSEIDLKEVELSVVRQTITIAKNIRTLRNNCGITQQELAVMTFMDKSRVSDVENGRAPNMTIHTLQRFATFFHTTTGDLLRDWGN